MENKLPSKRMQQYLRKHMENNRKRIQKLNENKPKWYSGYRFMWDTFVQRVFAHIKRLPTFSDYEVLITLLIIIIQVYVQTEHMHENTCTKCSTVQVSSSWSIYMYNYSYTYSNMCTCTCFEANGVVPFWLWSRLGSSENNLYSIQVLCTTVASILRRTRPQRWVLCCHRHVARTNFFQRVNANMRQATLGLIHMHVTFVMNLYTCTTCVNLIVFTLGIRLPTITEYLPILTEVI